MQLAQLTSPQVAALSKDIPVVIPIAALEQHGPHLPVFTDSMLLGEIVRRVAERYDDRALFTPLLWLGNSHHHLDFAGTLSAEPRHYLDLVGGLIENVLHHGFRRILVLNGHGGNDVPGKQAVFELRQRHRARTDLLLLFATYWHLGPGPGTGGLRFHQTQMGHACEWETSMILRLAPSAVGPYQNLPTVEFGCPFEPASRGWVTQDRTQPGYIGSPHLASADKGEQLFAGFADAAASMLDRMIAWDGKSWNG